MGLNISSKGSWKLLSRLLELLAGVGVFYGILLVLGIYGCNSWSDKLWELVISSYFVIFLGFYNCYYDYWFVFEVLTLLLRLFRIF